MNNRPWIPCLPPSYLNRRFRASDYAAMIAALDDPKKLAELAIPRYIQVGDEVMVNPEWTDAAYEEVYFWKEKPIRRKP